MERRSRLKRMMILVPLVFAATLAMVVGRRMSAEAMAVVVGVVCGVAAGVPMSVLVMTVLSRRDRQPEQPCYSGLLSERHGAYPPVVVIQGGAPMTGGSVQPYYPLHAAVSGPATRQFHLVGVDQD